MEAVAEKRRQLETLYIHVSHRSDHDVLSDVPVLFRLMAVAATTSTPSLERADNFSPFVQPIPIRGVLFRLILRRTEVDAGNIPGGEILSLRI